MYQPYQIVWATAAWRGCPDERPWLIIDVRESDDVYGAFPISTRAYTAAGPYTTVRTNDVDLVAAGLRERSYIFYESTIEIGADEIRKPLGTLTGALLDELIEQSGL